MNADQILGPLRAILPVACTLLVSYGLLPQDIAAQIPDAVVAAIVAISALVTLGSSVSSWWSNRTTKMAATVAATPGVQVVVNSDAPKAMKDLADVNDNVVRVP